MMKLDGYQSRRRSVVLKQLISEMPAILILEAEQAQSVNVYKYLNSKDQYILYPNSCMHASKINGQNYLLFAS
jgi:hypothetical protein